MAFIYTRSQLKTRVNAMIQGRIGMLIDEDETMNDSVREAHSLVDMKSTRRKNTLVPSLFNGIFDYQCPTDMEDYKIIDIPAQAKRYDGEFTLVPTEEFDRKKELGSIAIDDFNNIRVLKIASRVPSNEVLFSELDSLTSGGGTWIAFGDGTNLRADIDDYIKGNGSLAWDINAAAGTTAGIQNTGLSTIDITDYLGGNGSVFVWAKINNTTGLTNFILRIGSSAADYYQKTITVKNDGTAFTSGWNLLRFDLTSLTTVGAPVNTTINYAAIYMTKAITKVSETDYKFDWLVFKRGLTSEVKYYSNFGWTTSAGAYIQNSTSDTDLLVAGDIEYDLVQKVAAVRAAKEADLGENKINELEKDRDAAVANYRLNNPSEAKIMVSTYYEY